MENEERILNGIRCEALNCVYNNGCNRCTADEICVKNRSDEPEHTVCQTFREV